MEDFGLNLPSQLEFLESLPSSHRKDSCGIPKETTQRGTRDPNMNMLK